MKHAASTQRERGEVWFVVFFFPSGWGTPYIPLALATEFFPSLCSSVSARLALGDLGSFIPSLNQRKLLLILPLVPRAVANVTLAVSAAHTEEAPPDLPG